ncbi:hypothetical protein [uncultured Chitinophaga sp.]|uniref:hypothetical protein n=1 Tax=uncultured Chitinophaga sp. TaxID=339340 RepID=UPI0025FEC89B|nr:hypothetical protein [uncultured Chitinophaga sp.]
MKYYIYLAGFLFMLMGLEAVAQTEAAYNHDKIAILPFHFEGLGTRGKKTVEDVQQHDMEKSLNCQERLYNVLTENKDRLLVDIQEWETTNDLLKKGNIDLRKAFVMDKMKLCQLLGVDAILVAEMKEKVVPAYNRTTYNPGTNSYSPRNTTDQVNYVYVTFFDGKTGHKIWQWDDINNPLNWSNTKRLDKALTRVFKEMRAKFPYTKL